MAGPDIIIRSRAGCNGSRAGILDPDLGLEQAMFDLPGGHRGAVEKALDPLAARLVEDVPLLGGLDALRDDLDVEAAGESEDAHADGAVARGAGQVLDEAAVDLEHVEGKAPEVAQAGVAAPEVVHRDLDALAAQEVEVVDRVAAAADGGAFGDLDLKERRGEGGGLVHPEHAGAEAGALESGDVDRHPQLG